MRVLLVTHYFSEHGTGIELVAGRLATAMTRRGMEVTWAASEPAPEMTAHGIAHLPMRSCNAIERLTGFAYPLWGPLSLLRLCSALKQSDMLHLHESLYLGNIVAFLAAKMLRKEIAVTQHMGKLSTSQESSLLHRLLGSAIAIANRTVARVVLGGSHRCVFISDAVREYYSSFIKFEDRAFTIYNGVDLDMYRPVGDADRLRLRAFHGWPKDSFVALFVGRFVARKRIETMRLLAINMPDVQWIFIGWGREDPSRWGLDNVRCLGKIDQPELADFYRAADLLVLPSVIEGFPAVVQEAMACGTPALITDVVARGAPGVEEVAFVCDPSLQKISSLLRKLIVSRDTLHDRRQASVRFAREHWDSEITIFNHVNALTVSKQH